MTAESVPDVVTGIGVEANAPSANAPMNHAHSELQQKHQRNDETERLLAELITTVEAQQDELQILREQLALRDDALDALPSHFMITQHLANDTLIAFCNAAMAQDHGFTRQELVGSSVRKFLQEVWQTDGHQQARQKVLAGEPVRYEQQVARRNGEKFWTGVTILPVRRDAQGRATHSVTMAADITAKREGAQRERELQEQLVAEMKKRELMLIELRLAQKLESIGRLAAGIAHEINTPIQYVGDSLHFLRSAFADLQLLIDECQQVMVVTPLVEQVALAPLRERLSDIAQRIDLAFLLDEVPKAFARTFEGAERVASIVRAMKEFSHPDSDVEFNPADLNHALQNTLIVATNEYKYAARVTTHLDVDLPAVMCNVGELNQVFLNLIVNAAHAIQDAGKSAQEGLIEISTARSGDSVEIMVADNGCGIPHDNLEKIYDPFFTTKEVGRGTGQGLAITRSIIVDKHGGSLQVYSEVGEGTQFIITIPIAGRPKGSRS